MVENARIAEKQGGRICNMRGREATVDDLYRVGEDAKAEIVNGEVLVMTPGGGAHGYAAGVIYASLLEYARTTKRGVALPDNVGFIVNLPNRRSFNPDAAFCTGGALDEGFVEGAPLFAIEVRSPEDYGVAAEQRLAAKRADYFAAGTLVVWDVDLRDAERTVRVYRRDADASETHYGRGQRAEAEPALPGWSFAVDDLFP